MSGTSSAGHGHGQRAIGATVFEASRTFSEPPCRHVRGQRARRSRDSVPVLQGHGRLDQRVPCPSTPAQPFRQVGPFSDPSRTLLGPFSDPSRTLLGPFSAPSRPRHKPAVGNLTHAAMQAATSATTPPYLRHIFSAISRPSLGRRPRRRASQRSRRARPSPRRAWSRSRCANCLAERWGSGN